MKRHQATWHHIQEEYSLDIHQRGNVSLTMYCCMRASTKQFTAEDIYIHIRPPIQLEF
jgi:hypothetical protein